jgi:hypothetical protein
MTTTSQGTDWAELARVYPATGKWPVYVAPGTHRWGSDADQYPRHRRSDAGIRGLFGLDRRDPWDIAEDAYCFECGNTDDRSGQLSMASDRDDFETIASSDIFARADASPTLVAAKRPCDSLLELGWPGILNVGWTPTEASVVLRSWEERFGAVPLSVSNSTLSLLVARPPLTVEEARQVAREHFHFCSYDTQFHGLEGISPYVRKITGARDRDFWWD